MEIENKQEWKICKNNLSEENPCGICFSGSFGKTVFHKCANGVNHVFCKACMKTWYNTHTSSRTCPICKEEVSIGVLKGRYQDPAEKFEKWNYRQVGQVEHLIKKVSTVGLATAGVITAAITAEAGTVTSIATAVALGGIVATAPLVFGCGGERGRGKIATAVTALGAVEVASALTRGVFLRGEVVKNLIGAVAATGVTEAAAVAGATAGIVAAVAGAVGAELTGRATESLTRRIVRWMKE